MDEIVMGASELRAQWTSVLGAVAHAGRRVVVVRHQRIVGAFVSHADLERLRKLPPEPAPLTEHQKNWKRRAAMERHAALKGAETSARKALEDARALGDPLAVATAEVELEELAEAIAAALREGTTF